MAAHTGSILPKISGIKASLGLQRGWDQNWAFNLSTIRSCLGPWHLLGGSVLIPRVKWELFLLDNSRWGWMEGREQPRGRCAGMLCPTRWQNRSAQRGLRPKTAHELQKSDSSRCPGDSEGFPPLRKQRDTDVRGTGTPLGAAERLWVGTGSVP